MANERLRSALVSRGVTEEDLAEHVGVDARTVERWVTKDREPYRKHRQAASSYLGYEEDYLWPTAKPEAERLDVAEAEIVHVYPHRSSVPPDLWLSFAERATAELGVLVHAGVHLAENPRWHRILVTKAAAGVRIRMLLGDPDSPEVARRGEEEEIGEGVAYKVREVMKLYRPLYDVPGIEFRAHRSTLHNSLYRSDDELLVNTQIYGVSAPLTPVLHLRRVAGAQLVLSYLESFDKVWAKATPLPRQAT
ncbi:helix-turn-helix domain-containing protein [Kitasatospora kifunensis]|uniref:Transcriptional regulator with XRE-family HTH domain n=1 Tax=Kitasatospora kifunensis TaxID=58351 RepID=A0A7W7VYR9_KITKI|nr:helix-turn-helix transcriptional regulator [Kitasatospora kifunensis]MBB4927987.1 transcriptional regulator with XRE-family HTH domain [Kitasatospora kifunensis]